MSVADIAYEGGPWTKASHLTGSRTGYHISHVITPAVYAKTTCEQRQSLSKFSKYMPNEPIVWTPDGKGGLWWQTQKAHDLELRLLKIIRKRERGLRGSVSAIAVRLEVSRQALDKAASALSRRGLAQFTKQRGRYAVAVIRAVVFSIARPIAMRVEQLDDRARQMMAVREWDRYSEEEQDKLRADAYAFRAGLVMSLAAVGCTSVEEYLDKVGVAS